jgi:hypothetical protein
VALVVADAELLLLDLGDAAAGPDFAAEAVRLGPVPQEVRQKPQLGFAQPGGAAGGGPGVGRVEASLGHIGEPGSDGGLRRAEGGSDVVLLPAELLQPQGLPAPPLPEVRPGERFSGHEPLCNCLQADSDRSIEASTPRPRSRRWIARWRCQTTRQTAD